MNNFEVNEKIFVRDIPAGTACVGIRETRGGIARGAFFFSHLPYFSCYKIYSMKRRAKYESRYGKTKKNGRGK